MTQPAIRNFKEELMSNNLSDILRDYVSKGKAEKPLYQ